MNNILLKIAALLVFAFFLVSCEKEEVISSDDLPAVANSFLKDHFKDVRVLSVVKEKEGLASTEYQVLLDNGVEINFDKNGNWDEVDSRNNGVIPTTFILESIVKYVNQEYPTASINGIDKENYGFDIDLTNGLELVFDKEGKFSRIDP